MGKKRKKQHGGLRSPSGGRPPVLTDPVLLRITVESRQRDALNRLAAREGVSAAELVRGWIDRYTT